MALSIYSNWATPAGMALLPEFQSEVADALLGFFEPVDASDLLIDSFLNPPDDSITDSKPPFTDPSLMPLVPPPSDDLDFDIYRCSKHPRSSSEDFFHPSSLMLNPNSALDELSMAHTVTSFPMQAELTTEFVIPRLPPVMECSLRFNAGMEEKKASLSAQGAAARERRRRISEKTNELSRLIPGGKRMTTAEMFHAAYKYVKFLQAQIGILELMGSDKMQRGSSVDQVGKKMEVLLASPTIQEKLCGKGKCLAAKDMVETLTQDKDFRSSIVVSRELDRFIQSMG